MLIAVDIGNSNTMVGVFDGARLTAHWRLTTNRLQTADELCFLLTGLLAQQGVRHDAISGAIVASVVPPMDAVLREAVERLFGASPLFVGPGLKTGMPILYDSPADVGADRIANAVAGFERHGGPLIVVDFGTATTMDVVSAKGEYLGGLICPGLAISAEALFSRTARLPRVELRPPGRLIGNTTVGSIQSGLYYGYAEMVGGLLARLQRELGGRAHVIATGGLAALIAPEIPALQQPDELLTLEGLRLLWERNR